MGLDREEDPVQRGKSVVVIGFAEVDTSVMMMRSGNKNEPCKTGVEAVTLRTEGAAKVQG